MLKKLTALSLFLINCAPVPDGTNQDPEVRVEDELYPFVLKFYEEAQSRGVYPPEDGLVVEKMRMENHILGVCYPALRIIRINSFYWDNINFSIQAKEAVIFHELAHCVLGRGHKETLMQTNEGGRIPSSLMYPQFFSPHFYVANYQHYLQELFFSSTMPPLLANTLGDDGFDFDYYRQYGPIVTKVASFSEKSSDFDISNFNCEH